MELARITPASANQSPVRESPTPSATAMHPVIPARINISKNNTQECCGARDGSKRGVRARVNKLRRDEVGVEFEEARVDAFEEAVVGAFEEAGVFLPPKHHRGKTVGLLGWMVFR